MSEVRKITREDLNDKTRDELYLTVFALQAEVERLEKSAFKLDWSKAPDWATHFYGCVDGHFADEERFWTGYINQPVRIPRPLPPKVTMERTGRELCDAWIINYVDKTHHPIKGQSEILADGWATLARHLSDVARSKISAPPQELV